MIGFPGLGLEFEIDPVIIRLGWFQPRWYGLIIGIGFLAAVFYCLHLRTRFGILSDDMMDMLFVSAISGILGARIGYVIFEWEHFSNDISAIFFFKDGVITVTGLSIYGGIVFSVIACVIFCRIRKNSVGAMLDLAAFGFLIGQAVGRWGNFVNREVYGTETTLPWRMTVNGTDVHPLFLYECLWNIAGFILLRLLLSKRKYNGQLFTLYVAWYGLGRGFMEGMRNPMYNLTIGEDILIMQVFAFATCLVAMTAFVMMTFFVKKEKEDLLAWTVVRDQYIAQKKAKKEARNMDAETLMGEQDELPEDSEENGEERDEPAEDDNAFFEEETFDTVTKEEPASDYFEEDEDISDDVTDESEEQDTDRP